MAVSTVVKERAWARPALGGIFSRLRSLAYVEAGKRDLRLDLLRGLAAAAMVVDHVGGDTMLTRLSGGNRFIVSAAEGFIFLSGLVLGTVYGERIRRAGPGEAVRGMLQRAATLYRASAGMALAFLSLFLFTDLRMWVGRDPGLNGVDPVAAAVGVLTLHFSFHGSDVLVMYTLFLAAAPLLIYLLHGGRTFSVILGSLALWAVYQRYPEEATVPWVIANSSFPLAAWQLLFALGMVVGFHRKRVSGWLLGGSTGSQLVIVAAAGTLGLLAWSEGVFGDTPLPGPWFGDATYASLFAKVGLGPGRVLAFLSMAVLAYAVVHALWAPLGWALGWFLLPMGQNSLYVYIMHLFAVVLIYNGVFFFDWVDPDAINLAAQTFGLGLLWILVRARFLFGVVPR